MGDRFGKTRARRRKIGLVPFLALLGCGTQIRALPAGTLACGPTTATAFSSLSRSFAFRTDIAGMDPTDSTTYSNRTSLTVGEEGSDSTAFAAKYAIVPDPVVHNDGRCGVTNADAFYACVDPIPGSYSRRHDLATIRGRPNADCGSSGTIEERIANCATANGVRAQYLGDAYGMNGEGDWKLVARVTSGSSYEVWRDERTKLLWSDVLTNNNSLFNWFQASGYSSSAATATLTGSEGGAGLGTDCVGPAPGYAPNMPCQPATPLSACASAASIANLHGVATYQNTDGTGGTGDDTPALGNLRALVRWRLPSREEWVLATLNGQNKVLQGDDNVFWSATSLSGDRAKAIQIQGWDGIPSPGFRTYINRVRCVAPSP